MIICPYCDMLVKSSHNCKEKEYLNSLQNKLKCYCCNMPIKNNRYKIRVNDSPKPVAVCQRCKRKDNEGKK